MKSVWVASRARDLMRSWPTNTTEDCNWTHNCQAVLSIWPPHSAINQQVLERTWKQRSHDGRVNTESLLSSESVGLGPEGKWLRGLRSGFPAATGSSSCNLHVSDRAAGEKCKYSSWTFLFLLQIFIEFVSSVLFYFVSFLFVSVCICVPFFFFALASNCCCFLNLKTTVPSLHMHVYFNMQQLPKRMGCVSSVWTKLLLRPFQSVSGGEMKNDHSWCNASVN